MNIIRSNKIHLELESFQKLLFSRQYLFLAEGAMRNFLRNNLTVQRVDILVL